MNALGNDTKDIVTLPVERHVGWGAPAVSAAVQTGLVIGGTGDGKSVSVERDLQQYPQVINQVTKGPRDFSITFFQALDQILGTSYYIRFRRLTEYEMLMQVANLAFVHAIGVIVCHVGGNMCGRKLIRTPPVGLPTILASVLDYAICADS
jgi:hypothetical protein